MILLDSHVVIWLAITPKRISAPAAGAIKQAREAGETLAISAATIYEVECAIRCGNVQLAVPHQAVLAEIRSRFDVLPVTETIASFAAQLAESFQGDPFDRFIVATAVLANCLLISADRKILDATLCKTLW